MEIERFAVWICEVEEAETGKQRYRVFADNNSQVFNLQGTILQ